MLHELKTWSKYFNALVDGTKNFELRKNDRNFQVGDVLKLVEVDENNDFELTGRAIIKQVIYILEGGIFGLEEGFCILGLKYYIYTDKPVYAVVSGVRMKIELWCPKVNMFHTRRPGTMTLDCWHLDNPNVTELLDENGVEIIYDPKPVDDPKPLPIGAGKLIYGAMMFNPAKNEFWEEWLLLWSCDLDDLDYKYLGEERPK